MSENSNNNMKLGFGFMRLPRKGPFTDIEQVKKMVDMFMEAGGTYYDTAFIYPGSEEAMRKSLVSRYPRESFKIATKLYAGPVPTEKMAKDEFRTSLKRTGAEYFDYYLLHSLMQNNYKKYEKFHLWEFVEEQKKAGTIKEYGISYHDGPKLLEQILREHPDISFVQLQINYADWENTGIASRANYEVARKYDKPVIVMEPVKGGALAKPSREIRKIFDELGSGASYASYAIRFAASLEGVRSVLSGMSNIDQMKDNLSYMKDFKPLDERELEAVRRVQAVMGQDRSIPCTSCRYCVEGCPKQIPIPDVFSAMNEQIVAGHIEGAKKMYVTDVPEGRGAADCIACGKCEQVCPQHIKISERMKEGAEMFAV